MNPSGRKSNAERKLDGAKFFLERLRASDDDPYSVYHFATAVLNAARSVDYALRHEAGTEYRDWLAQWLNNLESEAREFTKDLIRIRGEDVHGEGVPLTVILDVATIDSNDLIAGHFSGAGLKRADVGEFWDVLRELTECPPGAAVNVMYEFAGLGRMALT